MKRIHTSLLVLLLMSLVAFSCNRNMNQASGNKPDDELADERQQLSDDIRKGIANLNVQLEKVNKDMENASDDVKAKLKDQAKSLEKDRDKLNTYLDRVGDQSKSKWQEFKAEVRSAVDKLNNDLDDN